MADRRADLDKYVRQVTRPDADKVTTLGDPDARQVILEEVMSMPSQPSTTPRAWSQRRVRVAAVAGALAIAAAVTFVSVRMLGSSDPTPAPVASGSDEGTAPGPSGDLFGSAAGLSCVEQYSPATLASRGFAFSGAVARIGAADAASAEPYVPVTFAVERWFRGGQGNEITVRMFAPDAITSAGGAPYRVGSRLLVAGERRGVGERPDELLAWACGFTRWYSAADAGVWDGAFR
jgi:hypothetical protein